MIRGSVDRKVKKLLIVMDPGGRRDQVTTLLEGDGLELEFAATGEQALAAAEHGEIVAELMAA